VRTIAIAARKGGSGKTTVAVHLALSAYLAGKSTLVVDTDPQKSAIEALQGRQGPGPQWMESTPAGLFSAQVDAQKRDVEVLIIDTPAGSEEGMINAAVLADLTLLVLRPTFLDLAAVMHTASVLRRLRKPNLVIINQAPVSRDGVEPPAVKKALQALAVMRLAAIPVVLRSRASYQTTIETGRSAVELAPASSAAVELNALWAFVERFALGRITRQA
jgi:chromosome partitioning protein